MPQLAAEDVRTDLATREAPLKWVIVVDRSLPAGLVANAVACLAAAVGKALPNLVGPAGQDASGTEHAGLPWAGCTVLGADAATVAAIRASAAARPELHVADVIDIAQQVRVYDGYLAHLAETRADDLTYHAVSVVGPRNTVGKLTRRLPLLG